MKTLLIFAVTLAVCYAELCRDTSDCSHEVCGAGWHLTCHNFACTCLADSGSGGGTSTTCKLASDCQCDRDTPHCVDGHCRCGFRPGGGK
ncbi:serine protease inhibitor Cvsi-2-like [Dreissena polymorpha]|uniref:Uncharacterized protein n=1 Tax=Dreissena polymorpha TaxID=45954 RepID=A0A9D4R7X2_DREPO|nr:serine protease inhibitor Cvsi-2-like [Dreissena polymorpha]KAH3857518.1 hypothetical protein DPMN_100127 [Dreissena polymorpha]